MDSSREPASLELVVNGPRGLPPRTFEVGAAGGWIGRGRDCEVPIDDPDRFVSLRHARIDYAAGQFWLTDRSTNGTFLNGAATPMASDRRYPLQEGDHFRIGLFDLRIAGNASAMEPRNAAAQASANAAGPGDPLLEFDPLPTATGQGPTAQRRPLREPDPLAALLSDLTNRPAELPAPEPKFSPDAPMVRFVGTTSELADKTTKAWEAAAPLPAEEARAETTPAKLPAEDMLVAMAAEFAGLSPALHRTGEKAQPASAGEEEDTTAALPAARPARPIDPATAALAAFWCGLGIIPRGLDPNDLVDVMAELGMAFREAAEGFSTLLTRRKPADPTERNPFGSGHGGLRRHLDAHPAGAMRLDEAVREVFARNERRNLAYREAVQAGVERIAESLSASAIERRFADLVHARFPRSRQAELWRLFRALEKELGQLAEGAFRTEVDRRMNGEQPRSDRDAGGGFAL